MNSKFNYNALHLPETNTGAIFIDCEATGLEDPSYPISVGISCESGFESQCLIKPDKRFDGFFMNPKANEIHKIPESDLIQYGYTIEQVSEWLTKLSDINTTFLSDNPYFENKWLDELFTKKTPYLTRVQKPFKVTSSVQYIIGIIRLNGRLTQSEIERIEIEVRRENPHTHNAYEDARFWARLAKRFRDYTPDQ